MIEHVLFGPCFDVFFRTDLSLCRGNGDTEENQGDGEGGRGIGSV